MGENSSVPEVEVNEASTSEAIAPCNCPVFLRYADPFAANYRITNCAALSARLKDKWGNLREGQTGFFTTAYGDPIHSVYTVDGLRNAASGKITVRGDDYLSPSPGTPCDIIFVLWVLHPRKWGARFADSSGLEFHRDPPQVGEDFHIVSGRLDCRGNIPTEVYSTNGTRPLEGPSPINDWALFTGAPITDGLTNQQQFYPVDRSLSPNLYSGATIPSGIDLTTMGPVSSSQYYIRMEFYNDLPTTEVFIIEHEFMETFLSSS